MKGGAAAVRLSTACLPKNKWAPWGQSYALWRQRSGFINNWLCAPSLLYCWHKSHHPLHFDCNVWPNMDECLFIPLVKWVTESVNDCFPDFSCLFMSYSFSSLDFTTPFSCLTYFNYLFNYLFIDNTCIDLALSYYLCMNIFPIPVYRACFYFLCTCFCLLCSYLVFLINLWFIHFIKIYIYFPYKVLLIGFNFNYFVGFLLNKGDYLLKNRVQNRTLKDGRARNQMFTFL